MFLFPFLSRQFHYGERKPFETALAAKIEIASAAVDRITRAIREQLAEYPDAIEAAIADATREPARELKYWQGVELDFKGEEGFHAWQLLANEFSA